MKRLSIEDFKNIDMGSASTGGYSGWSKYEWTSYEVGEGFILTGRELGWGSIFGEEYRPSPPKSLRDQGVRWISRKKYHVGLDGRHLPVLYLQRVA